MAKKDYFVLKQGSVNGQIYMNSHVFSMIAYSTLKDIDGVIIDSHKDIVCTINDSDVCFDIKINIRYGKNVAKLTVDAQNKVSDAINQYTGVKVSSININVDNIEFE